MKKVLLLASAVAALLLLSGCAKNEKPANEPDNKTPITDTTTDPTTDPSESSADPAAADNSPKGTNTAAENSGTTGSSAGTTTSSSDKKTSNNTGKTSGSDKTSSSGTAGSSASGTGKKDSDSTVKKPSGNTTQKPSGTTTKPSSDATKDPSKDTPKQPETPAVDKAAEKQKEIEAENKQYEDDVSRITISYDSEISMKKSTVQGLMQKCGVSYLNSESYYASQYNSLQAQINQKSAQLASAEMGGRRTEAAQLQRELDDLYAQSEACLVLQQAAREQDQLYSLESEKQSVLDDAYREHQMRLAEIENKYK